jgi:cytochrome c oxidase subunit 2
MSRMNIRRTIRLTTPFVLVSLVFCSTGPARGRNTDVEPQVIEIHAKKFTYEPAEITVHKGQTYKLHLSTDDVAHSLRIKALSFNAVMKPGQPDDVLFTPEQVGDFKADCGVFCGVGHTKMTMTVHVVE